MPPWQAVVTPGAAAAEALDVGAADRASWPDWCSSRRWPRSSCTRCVPGSWPLRPRSLRQDGAASHGNTSRHFHFRWQSAALVVHGDDGKDMIEISQSCAVVWQILMVGLAASRRVHSGAGRTRTTGACTGSAMAPPVAETAPGSTSARCRYGGLVAQINTRVAVCAHGPAEDSRALNLLSGRRIGIAGHRHASRLGEPDLRPSCVV